MEEEKYIIENQNSFELKDIFECGQCFRWNEQEDGSYIGVIKNGVIQVKKEKKICKEKNGAKEINKTKEIITFTGKCDGNLQEIVEKYFDLKRDYEKIKSQLENIDEYLKTSIEYGKGIRILNQDLWETIISFIISANNNIPRIKGIIERISQKYGNEIEWNGKKYYTFPTPEQLKNVTVQEFRNLGLGFRDIRLYETTQMILNKEVDLENLRKNPNTQEVRNELLKLSGVGPKVADCILLFSDLKRFDVFPIDVWVRRVMNDLYIKESDESKVSKAKIEKLAEEKFGDLKGLAQQYLFYWRREN
jgi:N-glycosylase/DNA lyase